MQKTTITGVFLMLFGILAQGQTTQVTPFFRQQFFTDTGAIAAGYKLCAYQAGTSTPLNTYTDQSGATPNANPVILDSTGSGNIWLLNRSYKLVLRQPGTDNTCNTGTIVKTVDNVAPFYRYSGTAAPVSGTYQTGDFVWNTGPVTTPGSTSAVLGWTCTAGGTPGTWAAVSGTLADHIPRSVTVDQNATVTGNLTVGGTISGGFDPAQYTFHEDFERIESFNGAVVFLGTYGWGDASLGNGCSALGVAAPTIAHPSVSTYATAAVANGDGCVSQPFQATSAQDMLGPIGGSSGGTWSAYIVFAISSTANVDVRVGFADNTAAAALAPSNGIFLRYISSTDATTFTFENRAGGTPTTSTTNSIAANTTFNCVKISSTGTGGSIGFQIGATCSTLGTQTIVTGAPTGTNLTPAVIIASDGAAAAKTLSMDLFYFNATSIGR